MKKLVLLLALLLIAAMTLAALDFKSVDDLYDSGSDNQKVYATLQTMLKDAKTGEEKS